MFHKFSSQIHLKLSGKPNKFLACGRLFSFLCSDVLVKLFLFPILDPVSNVQYVRLCSTLSAAKQLANLKVPSQ